MRKVSNYKIRDALDVLKDLGFIISPGQSTPDDVRRIFQRDVSYDYESLLSVDLDEQLEFAKSVLTATRALAEAEKKRRETDLKNLGLYHTVIDKLFRLNICSKEDLRKYTLDQLASLRGIGATTLREIDEALQHDFRINNPKVTHYSPDTDIGCLDWWPKTLRLLRKHGINTMGELVKVNSDELMELPEFGIRSRDDVDLHLREIAIDNK